jgi:ABC-type transport system involved in multi-copper enzyme maturation permease subunit
MTWVAWRVQRLQYLTALGVILVVGIWLALSGWHGDASWSQASGPGDIFVMSALPGLLGLALGASLVAEEFHRGTNRLAWSQSISRMRWLESKLAVGAVVVCSLTGLLVPLMGWWSGSLNTGLDVQPKLFDITGVVIVGYALFAFMLGTALGAVIHKPGWAFAAGVPIFALVRLVVGALRSSLVSPVSLSTPFQTSEPNGWVLHYGFLPLGRTTPAAGRTWFGLPAQAAACFSRVSSAAGEAHCVLIAHLHWVWQYQPESHYWSLQWAETAIFVGLALVGLVATLVAVRHQQA